MRFLKNRATIALCVATLAATACVDDNGNGGGGLVNGDAGDGGDGDDGGEGGGGEGPSAAEVVVHTGAGGGSDVFARAVTQLLADEGITSSQWPVINVDGGSGAAAMSHMVQQSGRDDVIAAVTMTWITTPLTAGEEMPTLDQLTPVAQVLVEPTFIAVNADAPFDDFEGMITWAEENPGQLTQAGGSPTAHASLVGDLIQEATGTDWRFLSFPGGGERIAALLSGDADLMLGSVEDFAQQVEAGDFVLIGLVEDERFEAYPDVPTLAEEGYEIDTPDQVRGFVGPPDMSDDQVAFFQDAIAEATETEAWEELMLSNGWISQYAPADEFGQNLDELAEQMETILTELGEVG